MVMKGAVLYYRSTKACPPSRQRPAAMAFVEENGLTVLGSFTERLHAADLPALKRAITACRKARASLLLSNPGRLVRSTKFTGILERSGVEFETIDDPDFNATSIGILAQEAREEARRSSRRIKDGMAAAKARGVKFGSARPGFWQGKEHRRGYLKASKEAGRLHAQRAKDYYAPVMPRVLKMRAAGWSYWKIAETLNGEGLSTQTGNPYTDVAVLRIVRRYGGKA